MRMIKNRGGRFRQSPHRSPKNDLADVEALETLKKA